MNRLALAVSACGSNASSVRDADQYIVNCDGADGGAVTSDENYTRFVEAGRQGQTLTLTIERAVFFRGDINQGPSLQPQPYPFVVGP